MSEEEKMLRFWTAEQREKLRLAKAGEAWAWQCSNPDCRWPVPAGFGPPDWESMTPVAEECPTCHQVGSYLQRDAYPIDLTD